MTSRKGEGSVSSSPLKRTSRCLSSKGKSRRLSTEQRLTKTLKALVKLEEQRELLVEMNAKLMEMCRQLLAEEAQLQASVAVLRDDRQRMLDDIVKESLTRCSVVLDEEEGRAYR